ncbi:hypothetical protein J1N35_010443 [Gossypium stocksii]|uniref:DUF659 domain-containing protein n=1 Tax=Gossypium stocksii TaxID=47602 RepID=A0A9D3W2H6_9ROSI|nr:hypothetical protein J1N35_010443 [Gossypium stocksii]
MASQSGSGSVDSSNNVTNASLSQDDISNTPLWRYVTKLPKTVEGGGNVSFVCNFCNATFKGSYSRVKAHLLKLSGQGIQVCPRGTLQHLAEMQKIVEDEKLKLQPKIVPLPPSSQTLASSFGPNTTSLQGHSLGSKRRKGPLEQSFNLAARENLDSEIARMFYSGGLPFHLARNPNYVNVFTLASKNSSPGGVVFLKVVNCEKEYKDKFYVETLIKDAISEVGAQNVVQVITVNATICKAVGSIVETQHPHIFWTPCVKLHNESLYEVSNFNSFVPLKLLVVVDSRFASMIMMLKRLKLIKQGLQNTVINDEWSTYKEDDVSKAYLVKEKILDDL